MAKCNAQPRSREYSTIYAALEKWAADEMRSVNGQIEYLLTDAARRAGRAKSQLPERPRKS